MVKDAKLEFRASIKLRRVYKTIFFSDQGGSWHCLQYICRLQVLRGRGRASLAPCYYNFNRCDRALEKVSTPSKFTTGIELENYAIGHEMSNQQSESRASPTQQTWIPLGLGISSNLIGVVGSGPIAFRKHSEKTTLRL